MKWTIIFIYKLVKTSPLRSVIESVQLALKVVNISDVYYCGNYVELP